MGDNGPHNWWIDMPPVSRAWLTSAVVSTLAMKFGALNPMLFAFDTNLIWNHFQVQQKKTGYSSRFIEWMSLS